MSRRAAAAFPLPLHCRLTPLMTLAALMALVALAACATQPATRGRSSPQPSAATSTTAKTPDERGTFVERRAAHTTQLTKRGPITDTWPTFDDPEGAERVTFRSGGLELWGWYGAPPSAGSPAPALLYLHGHFFMKPRDFERLKALQARGFAIMTATLRGRNGNGGAHELLYGEVDDAVAAARWLAARPEIDEGRIYVFGHSMGGGAAALTTLLPDAPIKMTGGCGAVYSTDTWKSWSKGRDSDLVRFDPADPDEAELRVLLPHADQLVRPHVAFMGEREKVTLRNAKAVKAKAEAAGKTFEIVVVPGGHVEAIEPALARWFDVITADAGLSTP